MATTHPSKAKRKGFVTPLKLLSQKETPANSITFKKKKLKEKKTSKEPQNLVKQPPLTSGFWDTVDDSDPQQPPEM